MYKRILLPLDGSSVAEQALPHAVALSERFGAELILLRVLESIAPTSAIVPREALRRAEEESRALTQDYLGRVAARVREHDIPVQTVTIEGFPRVQIVQFAEANQIDLIVICSRGRSGISRWLIGSVADRVVRGASVPVVLVRAAKTET